jgi:hypothetical protein
MHYLRALLCAAIAVVSLYSQTSIPVNGTLTISGSLDGSGMAGSFTPPFTGTQPTGSCTVVGAQKTYIVSGASSTYTCTPASGTSCPCAWVQSSSGGGGSGSIPSTTSTLKGNGSGGAAAVSGVSTDCVYVNGTSGSCGGTPNVAVQANASPVGSRPTLDFIQGTGIQQTITDTGTKITVQTDVGSAIQTKATDQGGVHLLCSAGASSPLTCSMSPTLATYTDKMLVNLCVTGAITGATTLNVDTLGAKNVLSFAGSNPSSGDLAVGCRLVTYQSSDNSFRLPGGTGSSLSTTVAMDLHIGGCAGGVPYAAWGLYSGASAGCTGPSSTIPGIQFANSGANGAVWYGFLAEDWNGGNTTIIFRPANGSNAAGTVKYDLKTHCLAAGDSLSPISWDTVSSQTITEGSNGTFGTNFMFTASMSGCSAGNWFGVFIARDPTVGSNSNGNSWIVGAKLRYTRQ